jgi:hypothetical protein
MKESATFRSSRCINSAKVKAKNASSAVKQHGKGLPFAFFLSSSTFHLNLHLAHHTRLGRNCCGKYNTNFARLGFGAANWSSFIFRDAVGKLLFEFLVKATSDVELTSLSAVQHVISFEGSNWNSFRRKINFSFDSMGRKTRSEEKSRKAFSLPARGMWVDEFFVGFVSWQDKECRNSSRDISWTSWQHFLPPTCAL